MGRALDNGLLNVGVKQIATGENNFYFLSCDGRG